MNPKYRKYLDILARTHGGYSLAAQVFFNLARDVDALANMSFLDTEMQIGYMEEAKGHRQLAADLVEAGKQTAGGN